MKNVLKGSLSSRIIYIYIYMSTPSQPPPPPAAAAEALVPQDIFRDDILNVFHMDAEGNQVLDSIPSDVLQLIDISDHLPFPVSYNIRGTILNAISWNIMVNSTIHIEDAKLRKRIMGSLQYYINRLLFESTNTHILLFQEYNWEPGADELAPMRLLGEDSGRLNVAAWGILHSFGMRSSCGPGLLTYYKKEYLEFTGGTPYIIYNEMLTRPDKLHIPAPYFEQRIPDRNSLERNLVLILVFDEVTFVIQNTHSIRHGEALSYTKHILNYFKIDGGEDLIMQWIGRPEDIEPRPFPKDKSVVVSIIGDFNYVLRNLPGDDPAPENIQEKIVGDYTNADSFGNYLYKHTLLNRPAEQLELGRYRNIRFTNIVKDPDQNIREALFQEGGEGGGGEGPISSADLVPLGEQLLTSKRTEGEILHRTRGTRGPSGARWQTQSHQSGTRSRGRPSPSHSRAPSGTQTQSHHSRTHSRAPDGEPSGARWQTQSHQSGTRSRDRPSPSHSRAPSGTQTQSHHSRTHSRAPSGEWSRAQSPADKSRTHSYRRDGRGASAVKKRTKMHKKRRRKKFNSKTRKMKRKKEMKKRRRSNNNTKKQRRKKFNSKTRKMF